MLGSDGRERPDTWRMFELLGTECEGPRRTPEKLVCEAAQGAFLVLESAGGPVAPSICACVCVWRRTRVAGRSVTLFVYLCVPQTCLQ